MIRWTGKREEGSDKITLTTSEPYLKTTTTLWIPWLNKHLDGQWPSIVNSQWLMISIEYSTFNMFDISNQYSTLTPHPPSNLQSWIFTIIHSTSSLKWFLNFLSSTNSCFLFANSYLLLPLPSSLPHPSSLLPPNPRLSLQSFLP